MDEIIGFISKMLLAAVVFIGILGVLHNGRYSKKDGTSVTGYKNAIAANAEVNDSNYNNYNDSATVSDVIKSESPEITYDDSMVIEAETETDFLKYFVVTLNGTEYTASQLPAFRVISITDSAGNDYTSAYSATTKKIMFRYPGTYKVETYVYDALQHETTSEIFINVEEKQWGILL